MILARVCVVGLFVFCMGGRLFAQSEQLTLATNGQTPYVIIVSAKAGEAEQHAAKELAGFLRQVTGAEFGIKSEVPAHPDRVIAVGPGAARQIAPQLDLDTLGPEGIVIQTSANNLILTGGTNSARGTLYAVYTFLEDYAGCRWWSSRVSAIPRQPTLKINALKVRYVPHLEYRETFAVDAFNPDWAVRNKINGHAERLDAKHGGKQFYEGFGQTFYSLIPPEKYFAEHPAWFSEIKGERRSKEAQLCLANEEMRKELVKNLKARLADNPAATIASVAPNDGPGHCQCSRCAAVDAEEGSPAGSLLRFVNAVAADIEKEFPKAAISTMAYQDTQKPPAHAKPRPNVIVQLCSAECSFSRPLTHPWNRRFHDDVVGWSRICNRIYIWDFATDFSNQLLPHPNLRVLGPNIKFFMDHNVKGVFSQGAYCTKGAELAELRTWVLAKLLWDPTLDAPKLINEFLDGYYGPAGGQIREYLKLTHDAVESSQDWLGLFTDGPPGFLSFDLLTKAWEQLVAAEAAAKDNPDIRARVQVAQIPVMCAFLIQWADLRSQAEATGTPWPMPDSIETAYAHVLKVARDNNITHLREDRSLESLGAEIDRQQVLLARKPSAIFALMRFFPLPAIIDKVNGLFPAKWQFALDPNNQGEQAGWYKADFDDSQWAAIPVPAAWETFLGKKYGGVAWYRVKFEIPERLAKENVFLAFEGVDSEGWVYLNGKYIGERTIKSTGKTQAEFWDTPFELPLANARYNQMNILAVKVHNESFSGGIFKPVSLLIKE